MDIQQITATIYEKDIAEVAAKNIESLLARHHPSLELTQKLYGRSSSNSNEKNISWNQTDVFVIGYGDSFLPDKPPVNEEQHRVAELGMGGGIESNGNLRRTISSNECPLKTLEQFANRYLQGIVNGIHILPFFPYSSDDGFAIVDYYEVNPDLGTWDDITRIADNFRLMVDLVLNHCSAKGPWFKAFLKKKAAYANYFIDLPADSDVSTIVRPRTHPLLSSFTSDDGSQHHIWTTFSKDQVDLNFSHPDVLIQMIDALLFLVEKGAQVIRLDAIAYLWKELGTHSIHHPKTHGIVQLYRHILNKVAPWVVLITETNVPHEENMSYFGNGRNEAHMIYQFSLPPLILDAFLRGDAGHLSDWARTIPSGPPGPVGIESTYFNFCASHDGIGITPVHGILSNEELDELCTSVEQRGGQINYKSTPSGNIPYELNINYFSAIAEKDLPMDMRVQKFLASQTILLSVVGIPGIYIHSLIGSENWQHGVTLTGTNRSINRQKLFLSELMTELDDPSSLRHAVYTAYTQRLRIRKKLHAFHPMAGQTVLSVGSNEIFALLREARTLENYFLHSDGTQSETVQSADTGSIDQRILCLINTSKYVVHANVEAWYFPSDISTFHDHIGNRDITVKKSGGNRIIELGAWEHLWLNLTPIRE